MPQRVTAAESAIEKNPSHSNEITKVIGACEDRAALETRLASLTDEERKRLDDAIEAQRSHFLSEGRLPPDPRA